MHIVHPAGLVNGAMGIVIEIVFKEGQTDAENLPSFVIIEFGEQWKGPHLFGREVSRSLGANSSAGIQLFGPCFEGTQQIQACDTKTNPF
jgi:hypothetical protein